MTGRDDALTETLALTVPWLIAEARRLSEEQRQVIASRAAKIIAAQGDTLMYGSEATFGHGAREMATHQKHARGSEAGPAGKCRVCTAGQAQFSAGEVFNELAKGLAVLAFQPGGVRFRSLRWCAAHMQERWTEADGVVCPACLREERQAAAGKQEATHG